MNASEEIMETTMKLLIAFVASTGLALACGGMTQIDPPSLQLDAGPSEDQIESVVPELSGIVVLC